VNTLAWSPVLVHNRGPGGRNYFRPDPSGSLRAVSSGREYWVRPRINGNGARCSGWRLLVFDAGAYVGAADHPSLEKAKRVAQQWETRPALWL
jgi:hypothetical protein